MNAPTSLSRASALLLTLALVSCGKKSKTEDAGGADPALEASIRSAMDTSVSACDDFYQYACGNWLKTTEIPADRVYWGRTFSTISDRNEQMLKGILESAAKDPGTDPARARLGAYYGACMDEAAIESKGLEPVSGLLAKIDAAKTTQDFAALAGVLHQGGMSPLLELSVYADFKDPNLNIAHFTQGGLGLPDREYYDREDDEAKGLRAAYVAHVGKLLVASGMDAAAAQDQASKILAFETELARVSIPREDLYDPDKTYHRIERSGLQGLAPDFPWDAFFEGLGAKDMSTINVEVLEFYTEMPKIVAATAPETLRTYMRYQVLRGAALALPKAIEEEVFAFYGKTLFGQPEMKPRWRRCLSATEAAMGELLGQAYVAEAFQGDSKATAIEMIQGIEAAFEGGLPSLGWMDDETRTRAVEKARAVTNKIGYPDKWRDYSGLEVASGDWFQSRWNASVFNARYELAKVGGPVDKGEWGMWPQMVNAYYNPLNNEIVFPAGILQPPFFSALAPKAMNYGAIGMVMGHELSHGFDDSGRKFDPQGRLSEWWNAEAEQRFEEATTCVSSQYSGYQIQEGVNINGELTLGENIADMGGIKVTYRAYKAWEAARGAPEPAVAGLTPEQLLFVSFAQGWCTLVRPEAERVLIATDSHSPPRYRVNGPLANLPEFAEAFGCEVGSPMRPEKTCTVW